MWTRSIRLFLLLALAACDATGSSGDSGSSRPDTGPALDAGFSLDAGSMDAATLSDAAFFEDSGPGDAGALDAGPRNPADAPPLVGYRDIWGESQHVTAFRGGAVHIIDTCDASRLTAALSESGPRLVLVTASGCNFDLGRTVRVEHGALGLVCMGNATVLGSLAFGRIDDVGPRTNFRGLFVAGCQLWDGPRGLAAGHQAGDGLQLANAEGALLYRVGLGGTGDEMSSHRRSQKVVWLRSRLAYPLSCNQHGANPSGATCGDHDYGPMWSYGATEIAMVGSFMGGGSNRWPQMIGGNTDVAIGGGQPRSTLGPRHPVFLVADTTVFDVGVGMRCATGALCRVEGVDVRFSSEMDPAQAVFTSRSVPCTDEDETNCGSAWSFGEVRRDGSVVSADTLMDALARANDRRDSDRFGIPEVDVAPALLTATCDDSGPVHPHPYLRRFCDNMAAGTGAQGAPDYTTGDAFPMPPPLALEPDADRDGIPDGEDARPSEPSSWADDDANGRYDVEDAFLRRL